MESTDKFCIAQTWKSKFHVSIFMCLMLLAPLLVMLTCSWVFVGFGIFTLGFSFCYVPLCRNASSDGWSAWVSAAGYSSVSLCHKQELLQCSWYNCKGYFPTNFTYSELECIPAGRSNDDEGSFWQHCTCIACRSVLGMEMAMLWWCHIFPGTAPGLALELAATLFVSADIEGVLKPSTEVHRLEGKKQCCSN